MQSIVLNGTILILKSWYMKCDFTNFLHFLCILERCALCSIFCVKENKVGSNDRKHIYRNGTMAQVKIFGLLTVNFWSLRVQYLFRVVEGISKIKQRKMFNENVEFLQHSKDFVLSSHIVGLPKVLTSMLSHDNPVNSTLHHLMKREAGE